MNIVRFDGDHLLSPNDAATRDTEEIILTVHEELAHITLPEHWQRFIDSGKRCTRVDAAEGMLYLSLDILEESGTVIAIWSPGQLILSAAQDSPLLARLSDQLVRGEGQPVPLPGALRGLQLLLTLTADHNQGLLEGTEEAITALETQVMRHNRAISGHSFIELRRRLLALKRHTQPLEEICDLLHENEGKLLPTEAAGVLAPIFRRCGRINAEIVNLENYVAQVRDAYQNHLDLRLNRSMMTLTVLAAIFLPLSLIVGWYGMNFPMPEFTWSWGYGYVIALSIVCLALSIWYFRRKGML